MTNLVAYISFLISINYCGVICLQEENLVSDPKKHLFNVKHKQSHTDSYRYLYMFKVNAGSVHISLTNLRGTFFWFLELAFYVEPVVLDCVL